MSSHVAQEDGLAGRFRVLVTDLVAAQRVLTMLTGRTYQPTRFEAEEAGSGRWRVRFDVCVTADAAYVLSARLHRQVGVLNVEQQLGALLAASA